MSRLRAERLMVLVMLGALALRTAGLDYQELRGDESFGYFFSLQPLGRIYVQTLALAEPHPIASYCLQHLWLTAAGHSEFALRLLSALVGTLSVALIFRLGRSIRLPGPISVTAAAFLAISPYAIWHSQDARMYSLSLALTLSSAVLAVLWWQTPRPAMGVGYVVVSLLALHTHYFAVFVLAAQTAYILAVAIGGQAAWRKAAHALAWQASLGVLYLPWLAAAHRILTGYQGNGESPGLVDALRRSLGAMLGSEMWPLGAAQAWAWVAGALVALGALWLYRSGRSSPLLFLSLYLGLPLALTWLGALRRPIFDARYLVAAAPPFYLLSASALGPLYDSSRRNAWPRTRGWGMLVLLASVLLLATAALGMTGSLVRYRSDPAYSKTRGWRELAVSLSKWTAGWPPQAVRIAQNYPDPTLWYYYSGPVEHLVLPPAAHDAEGARREVAALVEEGVQVVLLPLQPAAAWDAEGLAGRALSEQYRLAGTGAAGMWPVAIYVRSPEHWEQVGVQFANGLELEGYTVDPTRLSPGGLLVTHLAWRWEDAMPAQGQKVFVQLLDRYGKLVAQHDRGLWEGNDLAAGASDASYAILLPREMAASPYRLIAGLYDPDQPGLPRVLTNDGLDYITLAEFAVAENPVAGDAGMEPGR